MQIDILKKYVYKNPKCIEVKFLTIVYYHLSFYFSVI